MKVPEGLPWEQVASDKSCYQGAVAWSEVCHVSSPHKSDQTRVFCGQRIQKRTGYVPHNVKYLSILKYSSKNVGSPIFKCQRNAGEIFL